MPRPSDPTVFESPLTKTPWSRRLAGPAIVLLVALGVWLAPRGQVHCHGMVARGDKPLEAIVVTLHDADDQVAWQTTTDEQGRFDSAEDDTADLRAAEYRVTLTALEIAGEEIPARFRESATTPLRVRLRSGNNYVRFNVTP